jgi:hypothetical protein
MDIIDLNALISNVIVDDCVADGFRIRAETGYTPDNVAFSNCVARFSTVTAGTRGFRATTGTFENLIINGCTVENAEAGIAIGAGVTNAKITNSNLIGCTTPISDSGVSTIVDNVSGYKTFGQYVSGDLAGDALGSKTFSITHGLGRAPAISEIVPYFIRNTAVNDIGIKNIYITVVNSTSFSGVAYVDEASATGGAVFNVGCIVNIHKQ